MRELLSRGRPERADIFTYDENSIAELFIRAAARTPKGGCFLIARCICSAFGRRYFPLRDNDVECTDSLFHANGWGRPRSLTLWGSGT